MPDTPLIPDAEPASAPPAPRAAWLAMAAAGLLALALLGLWVVDGAPLKRPKGSLAIVADVVGRRTAGRTLDLLVDIEELPAQPLRDAAADDTLPCGGQAEEDDAVRHRLCRPALCAARPP